MLSSAKSSTLLDDVRRIVRLKHYSLHTERLYCEWIKQFVKFHRLGEKAVLFEDAEAKIECR
ncbi:phage integrase N-terminal SAM-like domain-containing protein [Methylomonas koyamae]|uniref:phage integrase N-terminal SAM-like domain-containing protein n=1 Tax=Methylomonas koyamae TaxID=702114 RepID=UPI0007C970FF|nr:phage integrase N-terminal SAM-like domain-containing protein [Methylomonas koyamae]